MFKFVIVLFILFSNFAKGQKCLILNEGDLDISTSIKDILIEGNIETSNTVFSEIVSDFELKRKALLNEEVLDLIKILSDNNAYLPEEITKIYTDLEKIYGIDFLLTYNFDIKNDLFSYSILEISNNIDFVEDDLGLRTKLISIKELYSNQVNVVSKGNYLKEIASILKYSIFPYELKFNNNSDSYFRNDSMFIFRSDSLQLELDSPHNFDQLQCEIVLGEKRLHSTSNQIKIKYSKEPYLVLKQKLFNRIITKRIKIFEIENDLVDNLSLEELEWEPIYHFKSIYGKNRLFDMPVYRIFFPQYEAIDHKLTKVNITSVLPGSKKEVTQLGLYSYWKKFNAPIEKVDLSINEQDSNYAYVVKFNSEIEKSMLFANVNIAVQDTFRVLKDTLVFPFMIIPVSPFSIDFTFNGIYSSSYRIFSNGAIGSTKSFINHIAPKVSLNGRLTDNLKIDLSIMIPSGFNPSRNYNDVSLATNTFPLSLGISYDIFKGKGQRQNGQYYEIFTNIFYNKSYLFTSNNEYLARSHFSSSIGINAKHNLNTEGLFGLIKFGIEYLYINKIGFSKDEVSQHYPNYRTDLLTNGFRITVGAILYDYKISKRDRQLTNLYEDLKDLENKKFKDVKN